MTKVQQSMSTSEITVGFETGGGKKKQKTRIRGEINSNTAFINKVLTDQRATHLPRKTDERGRQWRGEREQIGAQVRLIDLV